MNNKAQITIEFVSVISFALLISVAFSGVIYHNINVKSDEESYNELEKIAQIIQNEIKTASESHEGYVRTFELPQTSLNENYTINVYNNTWVELLTTQKSKVFNVNYFEGTITKDNMIKKQNGVVLVGPK
ncbi:hypothetical protein JXM83_03550 [Candidatus Woesearchaeota archaeon]|nr:hypothetical protein [Candidatus Woesearchaeota archaeon]